jgi:sirohydrochlorin ferrochelatase
VLAATGSSCDRANAVVHRLAAELAGRCGWHGCVAAFATAVSPSVPEAIERLQRSGAGRIAVASWFLAPGLLPKRVERAALTAEPGVMIAEPLGAHTSVAAVVISRYEAAGRALRTTA